MTKNLFVSAVVLTGIAALTGCSSISSSLGLERHVPDETQVTVRPALTLPPDFNLKPPGTESPVSADHEQANSNAKEMGVETAAAKNPENERGFFGKLFHGDFFGNDVDATTAKPAEGDKPTAPPAGDASAPPPAPDINGTPQAPATK